MDCTANGDAARGALKARVIAISLSCLVGAGLMAVKFYAYSLTHSAAILSDALESIINVVASAFALFSILLASKPPDSTHPYGHGKIEYFSAGFEGALIILAAIGIFRTGLSHIRHFHDLPRLDDGLLLLLGASLVNLVLGLSLVSVGRRTESFALIADGKHVLTDVYTSVGVLVGLVLVRQTGLFWLDGVIACLVGAYIVFSGGALVRKSFSVLMDAAEPQLLKRIAELLDRDRRDAWIDIHQLRAWRSGNLIHVDLHLILPRNMSLHEAHLEAKALEKRIVDHFGGRASVLIHTDPCNDPDCPICMQYGCGLRREAGRGRPVWNANTLTMQGDQKTSAVRRASDG